MIIYIVFNGEPLELPQVTNLQQLLNSRSELPANFAVAMNSQFVPKSAYGSTSVNTGDEVELVVPVQGG